MAPKVQNDEDKKRAAESRRVEAKGRMIKLGDATVDLKGATPITVGDAEELERQGIRLVSNVNLTESSGTLKTYVTYFVRKVKPEATDEQIKTIPAWQMFAAIRYIQDASAEPPDPF